MSHSMLPVYALALSAFIFNTSEFIPVALLTDIGADFSMKNEEVGMMMTIYAWLVAVLSLPLMLLTARIERKKLLIAVFFLFIMAHGVAYLATNFTVLLISRAMVATAHAIFWSITASLVVRVAPDGKGSQALGLLATGGAVAMMLGLPLGRIVGQVSDWQTAFLGIGLLGIGVVMVLGKTLPTLPATRTGDLSSLPKIVKNPSLIMRYLLLFLVVTAHFTAYSYIEPFVLMAGFSLNLTTAVLLLFGVAGILSSFVFGRFFDKWQHKMIWGAFFIMATSLLLLWSTTDIKPLWACVALLWGASTNMLGLSLQMQVLKQADNDKDVAMSLFSAIFNVGIGAGAAVGGLVVAKLGLPMIGMVGSVMVVLAILLFGLSQQSPTTPNPTQK